MLDATQLLWTQIAAGVCLLIFAGLAYNLLRLRRQMEASKAWIKSDGNIVASEAKIPLSHTSDDQDDVDAVIRYRYRVGGQIHERLHQVRRPGYDVACVRRSAGGKISGRRQRRRL